MIPSPMNPTLLIALTIQIGSNPAEPLESTRRRFVFATDPAAVAEVVDVAEEERIVDLAAARLVPARIVGHLQVPDSPEVMFDRAGEIALHHLHMVNVVLQAKVLAPDRADDLERLRAAADVESGDVAGVDRLEEEANPGRPEARGGEAQILDQRLANRLRMRAARRNAGEAVQLLAAERARVLDRAPDAVLELADALGVASDAALAGGPVAGRQVVQDLRQTVL